jgi:hypothetical protein
MAQVFAINGTALTYITGADWESFPVADDLLGQRRFNRFKRHIWRLNEAMPMTQWEIIYPLEGDIVSITTTDPADINAAFVTFYGVNFESITGKNEATNMAGVTCEFLVRT